MNKDAPQLKITIFTVLYYFNDIKNKYSISLSLKRNKIVQNHVDYLQACLFIPLVRKKHLN